MPLDERQIAGFLPNIRGMVDAKVEGEIYRAFRRVYEYFSAQLDDQRTQFDRRLNAAITGSQEDFTSLVGVFSQPLAGSSTTDPFLESLIQNFGSQVANSVFAAPSVAAGNPLFRLLLAADIPNLNASKITAGVLALARLDTKLVYTNDNLNKIIAGAPYANDGYITINRNDGVGLIRLMTTA